MRTGSIWVRRFAAMAAPIALAGALLAPAAAQDDRFPRERALIQILEQSYAARPDPSLQYLLAENYARIGDRAKALGAVRIIAASDRPLLFPRYSPVWTYADDAEFAPLFAALRARVPVTANGIPSLIVPEPMATEGMAYDRKSGAFFLGDLGGRRVLRIATDGQRSTLVGDLALPPFGMAVDADRGVLWVATANALTPQAQPKSELLRIELASGRVQRFADPRIAAMNDVAVLADGSVALSDSASHSVWKLAPGGALTQLVGSDTISFPNGIASDGTRLWLAQGRRIMSIDPVSGTVTPMDQPDTIDTLGIDGLYFHDGALFAIQNVTTPGRVTRFQLDATGTRITGADVLDSANPLFDLPTTGAIVGDRLMVIANSQFYRLDDPVNGIRQLRPIVLLAYPAAAPVPPAGTPPR